MTNLHLHHAMCIATFMSFSLHPLAAIAALTDISTEPLNTYAASPSDVKPNVLFIMDDSGSMGWDYMPDQIDNYRGSAFLFKNSAFNGVAYNPAVSYSPPNYFNQDGTPNITKYLSMTGQTSVVSSGFLSTQGASTDLKPNWKAVPNDGYRIQSTSGTSNLENNRTFSTTVPGEYCDSPNLRNCIAATSPSGSYTYPAKLRWCNNQVKALSSDTATANSACRASYDDTKGYFYPRTPTPSVSVASIWISVPPSPSRTTVSSIKVNTKEILSGTTSDADDARNALTVASRVASAINSCSNSTTGNCTQSGHFAVYDGTSSGAFVWIYGASGTTALPVITKGNSGNLTFTPSEFAPSVIPGQVISTTISSGTTYAYPGSTTKSDKRTDCSGNTCTYQEEMTNYANWWAYYRTRMQMMKTSASRAFAKMDKEKDIQENLSRFRVGFMSINDTTDMFLNLQEFKTEQKSNWYDMLFSTKPGSGTPLRKALSEAGQLYGGKFSSNTLRGISVIDPLQYSCQQNYSILSTDGYWNGDSGEKLDGSTTMDNQDGALPPPYNDGGSVQASESSLQKQTSQLLASTSTLQTRTAIVQKSLGSLWESTAQLLSETGTLVGTVNKIQMRCDGTSTECGTAPRTGIPGPGTGGKNWYVIDTCSSRNSRQCDAFTPSPTMTRVVDSECKADAGDYNSSKAENGYQYSSCTYQWSTAVPAASCTYKTPDSTPNDSTTLTARRCFYDNWSAPVASGGCTYRNKSTATTNNTVYEPNPKQCSYSWTAPENTVSCTAASETTSTSNNTAYATSPVKCSYTAWSDWSNATSTCNKVSQSTGTSGTYNPVARECVYTAYTTPPTAVSSCTQLSQSTGSSLANLVATNCSYAPYSTYANADSCTYLAQSTASPYSVGLATNCRYTAWTTPTTASSCIDTPQSASPNYTVATARKCTTSGGVSNTLADVAAYYYSKDLRNGSSAGVDKTGTCTGPIISPSTIPNDLCKNDVPSNGLDVAETQHMTTFTLGLGAQGQMVYSPTYEKDQSGDFYDITKRTDASSSKCTWMASGKCTWPTPSSGSINNIDDLWHAAVNGRGTYYSASDPETLATGLSGTLETIINTPRPGTAAAAASSNPNISTSDNYVFSSSYKSIEWYGEVTRQSINSQGEFSAQEWSAMRLLDCATTPWGATTRYPVGSVFRSGTNCYLVNSEYVSGSTISSDDTANTSIINSPSGDPVIAKTSRTIYTKSGNTLIPFTWSDLVSASQDSYFKAPAISYVDSETGLSQFCSLLSTCLTSTQQNNYTIATGGAAGEALVNFLRGDRSNELSYYRERTHVLGDIVSSEGRYVKTPLFNYSDENYASFKAAMATRPGMVYFAANDGMLHAFEGETGQESWAYIPSFVLPNLYKLADKNYKSKHQYFVDNSPETGDICPNAPLTSCSSSEWKTILVGGLNRGGKGYFALDITNPATPTLLWEYTDSNLGFTYGNPRITKLSDGTWVVIFASGYNNSDGVGQLYIINATTGTLIRKISTGVGSATTPSGLSKISAHAPNASTNNTAVAVYGGDLLGNLWRFDINNTIGAAGYDAQLLVTLKDETGKVQPISSKPTVSTIYEKPVIFVGTGRYLGVTDVSNTDPQAFYAIKDNYDSITLNNPRTTGSGFVAQTLTSGTCPTGAPVTVCTPGQATRNSTTTNEVNWALNNGWYIDFVTGGERSTTDSTVALGTITFTTIYPSTSSSSACSEPNTNSAASYLYLLDFKTGGSISNSVSGVSLGNVIATRPVLISLPGGVVKSMIRTSGSTGDGTDMGKTIIKNHGGGGGATTPAPVRRVSWRELTNE